MAASWCARAVTIRFGKIQPTARLLQSHVIARSRRAPSAPSVASLRFQSPDTFCCGRVNRLVNWLAEMTFLLGQLRLLQSFALSPSQGNLVLASRSGGNVDWDFHVMVLILTLAEWRTGNTSLRYDARAGELIKFLESSFQSLGRTEPSSFPTPDCLYMDTYSHGRSLTTKPVFQTMAVKTLSNFTPGIVKKGNTWGFVALRWSKGRIFERIVTKIANPSECDDMSP